MIAERASVPPVKTEVVARSCRVIEPLGRHYFRYEARELDRLPTEQTILVTHHDGGVLPIDAILFGAAWYRHTSFDRQLYVLTHDFLHGLSKRFSQLLYDSGVIPADRGSMDAALATGKSVLVLPGAARETFRTYARRREIDLGGRTGFVAQAIRWGLPITPVVSAGGHETLFVLSSGSKWAKRLRIDKLVRSADVLPLLAGLPWGVWALPFLPQLPLPAKITSEVLAPIRLDDELGLGRTLRRSDADDPAIVQAGFRLVLERMRAGVNRLYDERRWPIIG